MIMHTCIVLQGLNWEEFLILKRIQRSLFGFRKSRRVGFIILCASGQHRLLPKCSDSLRKLRSCVVWQENRDMLDHHRCMWAMQSFANISKFVPV